MTQLNSANHSISLPFEARSDIEPVRRLIVPVPSCTADLTSVTQKVWNLAESIGASIQFLGLCSDRTEESSLRRTLVKMAAMVNYDHVSAQTEVIFGTDWMKAVKSRCRPGDMVVCFDHEQYGVQKKPLSEILRPDLDVPLYILTGFDPQYNPSLRLMAQAVAWTGFIVLILGFSLLQVKIILTDTSWTLFLELLTTAVEFWLILVWNHLFR